MTVALNRFCVLFLLFVAATSVKSKRPGGLPKKLDQITTPEPTHFFHNPIPRHHHLPEFLLAIFTVGFNLLLLWVLNGNNVRHCIGQIFKVHLVPQHSTSHVTSHFQPLRFIEVHYTVLAVIDLFLALASITDFILKFDLETQNENEQLFANHFFVRQHYENGTEKHEQLLESVTVPWRGCYVQRSCCLSTGIDHLELFTHIFCPWKEFALFLNRWFTSFIATYRVITLYSLTMTILRKKNLTLFMESLVVGVLLPLILWLLSSVALFHLPAAKKETFLLVVQTLFFTYLPLLVLIVTTSLLFARLKHRNTKEARATERLVVVISATSVICLLPLLAFFIAAKIVPRDSKVLRWIKPFVGPFNMINSMVNFWIFFGLSSDFRAKVRVGRQKEQTGGNSSVSGSGSGGKQTALTLGGVSPTGGRRVAPPADVEDAVLTTQV